MPTVAYIHVKSRVTHSLKHHVVFELTGNRSQGSLGRREGELEAALLTSLLQKALCSISVPFQLRSAADNRAEAQLHSAGT